MSTLAPYHHAPLPSPNHIRLLELSSCSNQDDPLTGTMRTVNIVDGYDDEGIDLPYVALSYRWSKDISEELLLDGRGTIRISQDLGAALRRFRYASALRWIWVDAICINQHDDAEKSIQIPLMAHIYRSASRVMIWLGNRAENVDLLRRIKSLLRDAKAGPKVFGSGSPTQAANVAGSPIATLRLSLSQLGRLGWFTRRWVLQELALNANAVLCCGQTELPWPQLAGVMGDSKDGSRKGLWQQCSLLELGEDSGLRNIQLLWDLWWNTTISPRPNSSNHHFELEDRDIAALVNVYSDFECSDGHDQIAALMGLSCDAQGPTAFRVDYADSVEQTYAKFAETLVRTGHMTWLLYQKFQREKGMGSRGTILPSWVPDWRLSMVAPQPAAHPQYTKTPAAGFEESKDTPGVYLLTTKFWHFQWNTESMERLPVDPPAVVSPSFFEISWKSTLFPEEISLEKRVALVLVDLWPHILAHLSEDIKDAEDVKLFRRRMWYGLLLQTVHIVYRGINVVARRVSNDDDLPMFGEEDTNDLEALRLYIRSVLHRDSEYWIAHQRLQRWESEELAEFLVFCQQAPDCLDYRSICSMGCVPASFYSQVVVGDKVLLANLGHFGTPYLYDSFGLLWSRYIVREEQLVAPEGFVDSVAEGLESTEQSSMHGINSYYPDSNSRLVSPWVYEFVAPCQYFHTFLLCLSWNNSSMRIGWHIADPDSDLEAGYDSGNGVEDLDEVRSIWIR